MKINKDIEQNYPWGVARWWPTRAQQIANLIPYGARVLDLGGGFEKLRGLLRGCRRYHSIDLAPWTDETIVADFNKREFPEVKPVDFIVCQGILEYIDNPAIFLISIREYGPNLILTYREGTESIRHNFMTINQVKKELEYANWEVQSEKRIGKTETIFYCIKV